MEPALCISLLGPARRMPGVAASLMQRRAIQSALLTLHFLGQYACARAKVLTCPFESGAVGEFFSQFLLILAAPASFCSAASRAILIIRVIWVLQVAISCRRQTVLVGFTDLRSLCSRVCRAYLSVILCPVESNLKAFAGARRSLLTLGV